MGKALITYFKLQHYDFTNPPQRKEAHVEEESHLKRQAGDNICGVNRDGTAGST